MNDDLDDYDDDQDDGLVVASITFLAACITAGVIFAGGLLWLLH